MKGRPLYDSHLFWILVAIAFVIIVWTTTAVGCHPLGTVPLEPTRKQDVIEQIEKEVGLETHDRQDCHEYYKAKLERCYVYQNCTLRQMKYNERKMNQYRLGFCRMRVGKFRW